MSNKLEFIKSSAGYTITQSELPDSKPFFIAEQGPLEGFFINKISKLKFLSLSLYSKILSLSKS